MEYSQKEVLKRVLLSLRQQGKQSIPELVFSTRLPYGVVQEAVKTLKKRGLIRIEKVNANPSVAEDASSLEIIELNE